jgi:hypothetical protein
LKGQFGCRPRLHGMARLVLGLRGVSNFHPWPSCGRPQRPTPESSTAQSLFLFGKNIGVGGRQSRFSSASEEKTWTPKKKTWWKMWNVEVPSKIRVSLRRLAHQSIPTISVRHHPNITTTFECCVTIPIGKRAPLSVPRGIKIPNPRGR